jgi:hypothetical protein
MTIHEEAEVRHASVSTKVLMVGFAVLAVLGSFWTIVWFIRSYVEAPRVTIAPSMALAARESTPVVPPTPTVRPAPMGAAEPAAPAAQAQNAAPTDPASGGIADRWAPITQQAAPPEPPPPAAAAPETSAPAALATSTDSEPAVEEVAETSVPAISGAAPLPRRKPTQTAAVRRTDPPLPRPRPDGPAPQSVWTASPTSDDRYPGQ